MQVSNLIKLIPTYSQLFRDARRQKKFVQTVLEPMIREASINNDGSLDEEDFNKIRTYYGFGVPAIVGGGIVYAIFNSLMAIAIYELLLFFAAGAFVAR